MTIKIGINGFGRIGRLVLRALAEQDKSDLEVVGINDLGTLDQSAHLFQFDSIHGTYPYPVKVTDKGLDITLSKEPIPFTNHTDPASIPWKEKGVDVVLECSGHFASKDKAEAHLQAGARKVLISAPAKDVKLTVAYGINHDKIQKKHDIISNASCTTNCLAPVAYALHNTIGIEHGFMTTIHAYTGDQKLVDSFHKDPRRARAAAISMIPTSTGAAKAVGLVLPELAGKLDGTAIRVPTPNVSMIDFKFVSSQETTAEEINTIFEDFADNQLKGILEICRAPLVSCDFNHSSFSSIADLTQTQVLEKTFCRVLAWYDNEWGFANRMLDTAVALGRV